MLYALADWLVTQETTNVISTGQLTGELYIIEEDNTEAHVLFDPSTLEGRKKADVKYEVYVQNTGEREMFIRLKVNKYWAAQSLMPGVGHHINEYDANTGFVEVHGMDPDKIGVHYVESDYWVMKEEQDENGETIQWFYYTDILEAEEMTAVPLMDYYYVNPDLEDDYRELAARVHVDLECIQVEANAIGNVWGISYDELGVEEPVIPDPDMDDIGTSIVTFVSPEDGFRTESTGDDDVLVAFEHLTPGEHNIQNIILRNEYSEPVTVYLYAEYVQEEFTAENLILINKLMRQYTEFTLIRKSDDYVIHNGPVWAISIDEDAIELENHVLNQITFAELQPGESREILCTLDLSPEIGNEYQQLSGEVQWVFAVRGSNNHIIPPDSDETEDGNNGGETNGDNNKGGGNQGNTGSINGNHGSNGKTVRKGSALKTGDQSRVWLYTVIVGLTFLLLALLLWHDKTIKKQNIRA